MSRRRKDNTIKRLAIGSSIAALLGYLAGLLSAPKSGKQTREDLMDASDKGKKEAEKDLKQVLRDLNSAIKDAKTGGNKLSAKAQKELKEQIEKAGDNKEKLKEIISALRNGDASDVDLKRAVKDATNAVDHLKDYLKK